MNNLEAPVFACNGNCLEFVKKRYVGQLPLQLPQGSTQWRAEANGELRNSPYDWHEAPKGEACIVCVLVLSQCEVKTVTHELLVSLLLLCVFRRIKKPSPPYVWS